MKLIDKIKRKWMKLRLQPIRVFCFHQTSETFDPNIYAEPDWIAVGEIKRKILKFKNDGYEFISLTEAYHHILHDAFRIRKYAVLTCDDGLKCQKDILPWLEENRIPMTMFVNIVTLDGKTCGEQIVKYFGLETKFQEEQLAYQLYLREAELMAIDSPSLEIGIHGYDHSDITQLSINEFMRRVCLSEKILCKHSRYVPFYAYAYGRYTAQSDIQLLQSNIIPVYMDGQKNYDKSKCIHRELI